MSADFKTRTIAGKQVLRLGLACNFGIAPEDLESAVERGVGYVFWTNTRTGKLRPALKDALKRRRDRLVLATGPSVGLFAGNLHRQAERTLKTLGTDTIDVFHLFWLGVTSRWADSTLEVLAKLKQEGKIRAVGISIHNRPRAGELSQDPRLDLLMIRYNAAHPGAEREIFPKFTGRKPAVVAYTATSWGRLLKKPRGWQGPAMTASDCYRFSLSNPNVDVVLTGPANRKELDENLAALDKGPLSPDEETWIREYGKAVHG